MCHTSPVRLPSLLSASSWVTRPPARSPSVNRHRLTPQALEANTAKLVAPCSSGAAHRQHVQQNKQA